MKPKPPVPHWRWATWYAALGAALVLFYGLFTPFWFGLRALAWVAEFRCAPRRSASRSGRSPAESTPCVRSPARTWRNARYVYDFDEPTTGGRELLGGKGIGLAEMTQMGVPVPAGFTITTDACRAYMQERDLPDGLADEVDEHVRRLEERTGKRFGSDDDPLLVSVRSGAAVSMPGMMDTILNLGLNDEAAEGLAARTGNPRFAYDSYRRLIQMFGEVVEGIDGHRFE